MTTRAMASRDIPNGEGWTAEEIIQLGLNDYGSDIAIASSFGAEDVVLIDLAARTGLPFRVFTLDTDFLFPETYALIDSIEQRYGIEVERCRSEFTPAEQARAVGEELWKSQPDLCCNLRKVEPLTRKLSELKAWITGIRRGQAPTRANSKKIEWDARFGLLKLNPLADWSWDDVWARIRENGIAYNPLHDRNYPSIGCTYCTRQVVPGEDLRAGRWSGTGKIECGLHVKQ